MTGPAPRRSFNRYPMLWLSAAFGSGIAVRQAAGCGVYVGVFIAAAAVLFVFLTEHRAIATAAILTAFAAAGSAAAGIEQQMVSPGRVKLLYDTGTIRTGEPVRVEGVLDRAPEPAPGGEFLTISTESIRYRDNEFRTSGNVRLFLQANGDRGPAAEADAAAGAENDREPPHLPGDPPTEQDGQFEISNLRPEISALKYGSRVSILCKLDRDDQYLNAGVTPKREVLGRLGLDAAGTIKSRLLIEHLSDESVFVPLAWVYDQRARLISEFRRGLSPPAAGVMIASLLGDRYFLDRDTAELFREGGTFHVLVISGLHITFIGGLLLLFVRLFTPNRWVQFAVPVVTMWAFTLAVGADLPVVRAAVMFTVVSFGYVIYRHGNALNSLGFCTLALLAWRPSDLFDPSFQLTFVSVAAIVGIAVPVISRLREIGAWSPTPKQPFPPNVPQWLVRSMETIYWSEDRWQVQSRRNVWTARLFKAPLLSGKFIRSVQHILAYIFEAMTVSAIVQIAMLPLMVWYFHRVSVAGVLMNLWVGLFLAVESFAAVSAVVLSSVSSYFSDALFAFADCMNSLMLAVPRLFSGAEWASFRLPAYSGPGLLIYFLYFVPILVLAVLGNRWDPFALRQPRRQATGSFCSAAALTAMMLIIIGHPFSSPRSDGRLHFDHLDVGQGDAALITFPSGETMLVDGGGRFKYRVEDEDSDESFEPDVRTIGEAVTSAFLWNRGYSQIDYIVATHADADHIQGLVDVSRNFNVGTAIFGRAPMKDPNFAALADVLTRRDVPAVVVGRGDHMTIGGVSVEVLYPYASEDPDAVSDNDHSVVLRLVYGSRSFLLTGDAERGAESAMLSGGGTVAADVVKVGHHGSRTSSTQPFVDGVKASYAVISVGRTSPFNHPHPEVVSRWLAAGAKVFRTGERGTVSISTDGSDLAISTFLP